MVRTWPNGRIYEVAKDDNVFSEIESMEGIGDDQSLLDVRQQNLAKFFAKLH